MSINKDVFNVGTSKKQIKESVTPHKICIAILIRQFCLFRESARYRSLAPAIQPILRRDFSIMILRLIQSPDLTLPELRNLLLSGKYSIESKLIEKFDTVLRDLNIVGISYLLDVMEHISKLTTEVQMNGTWCQINKNSVLGCYLRRLMLFFDKLTFSQVSMVFQSFKEYYKPCEQDIKFRRGHYETNSDGESDLEEAIRRPKMHTITWYTKSDQWSRKQAELFIATQAALLSSNEQAAQTPNEINIQIRNLLKSNPDLAEAHFLSYLNYLRVNEFCGAIDSLYHSFDKSTPINELKNNNIEEKLKGFRYAALNLAALYIHFGHKNEALAALKESIMKAQEVNDNICLQHALAWMYKLTNVNEELLITHSVLKSMELNLMYLVSLGIQSYIQYTGLRGGKPKQIFETMTKSDILNCQHTYRDQMSNSYSQKSNFWLLYGKTEMSLLWSQLLLHLNTDSSTLNKAYNGQGTCQALCNIADYFLTEGEYQLSSTVLQLVHRKFPNPPLSHNWMLYESVFKFVRLLNNGDWSGAAAAATQIAVIDKWESYLRLAELHITTGDYHSAQICIDLVMDHCQTDPNAKTAIALKIRAMIQLVELQCASGVLNIPSSTITILNSALSFCDLYHLDHLASIIHLHLANVQLVMGMPTQALKTLKKRLVSVLAHGGVYDRARAILLYVKCLVANAGSNPQIDSYNVLLDATEMLKTVKEDFQKIEARARVKDVLYLQAQLFHEMGHFEDRNDCALEYKQYQQEYQIKSTRTLITSL